MAPFARLSRVLLAAFLAVALLAPAAALLAATIPELEGPITDETGVLAGGEEDIEQAIDDLVESSNIQLWVVFVRTLDGVEAAQFASGVAAGNGLGGNDALLLVALDDRLDQIWLSDGLDQVTDDELDQVIGQELEPRLRDGDFVGAVIATADGLQTAAAPEPVSTAPPAGGGIEGPGGQPSSDGGGSFFPLVLIAGGGGLLAWWFMSRRARRRESEERDRRTGKLARDANALLIATDDRVRDAGQEIGFVEAEYGEAEVQPLRAAVAAAREELRQAFAVRQRLDDSEPETPEQREALLNEVVAHSQKAQAALDGEAARIQALRDLERDAPTILERLPERIAAAQARLPAAQAAWDGLAAFAPATRAPVVGHLEEARKGLDGATAATERGRTALAAGNSRAAASAARTAEQGLTGAVALLDAVEKLAATARDAGARATEELREAETDLAAARSAAAEVATEDGSEARIDAAATALREARNAASATPPDPITALRLATEAHRSADEALAAVRQDAEQHVRLLAAVDTSLATAQADVELAADFVATRRGSVGRQARTRLAEAERLLDNAFALRESDPKRSLDAARRAEQLAEEAYELADDDFDQFGGFGGGGRRARDPGTELAGAILGGILGGVLSGGGRGGGWGGSPWGSSGPFGGGGGWGGPFGGGGGGGWGGGGFGGGGFGGGGGGGRSRGGRW
jgi:hypothetical protein